VNRELDALTTELCAAIEELLLSGLSTASEGTKEKLGVAFREASRMRLLRLGSTLRICVEEVQRFDAGSERFSPARFGFFVERAWILARAMRDAESQARLQPDVRPEPLPPTEMVCVGSLKRHVPGAFAAFELRLRTTDADARPLTWSCVFPMKPGVTTSPETFLLLQQKQGFRPVDLLGPRCFVVQGAARVGSRLALGPKAEISFGERFDDWPRVTAWDREAARERLEAHEVDPLTLPIELQTEVRLDTWSLGAFEDTPEPYRVAVLESAGGERSADEILQMQVRASDEHVERRLTRADAPLLGVVHYERARLVMQPLALLHDSGPEHLTIRRQEMDAEALVKELDFG